MKQQSQFENQHGKYYRCRPSLYESLVLGPYLVDIEGTQLFIYDLENLKFKASLEVLSKEDIFCPKLRAISDRLVGVFGMYTFKVVSLDTFKIVNLQGLSVSSIIEFVQAKKNYLAILTSDEQEEDKLLYFWKFTNEGTIQKQYTPFEVHLPDYEECSEDRLEIAIFQSIDLNPKVYLFWKTTSNLIELDPGKMLEERYNRSVNITFLTDIDNSFFCEISQSKIKICSKKGAKEVGSFMNANQEFKKIIIKDSQPKEYFSISNHGVKKWLLQNNTQPLLYTQSQKYPVQSLFLNDKGELVGVNLQKKYILIWRSANEVIIHNFPNEVIKKIMKVSETVVCLLLQATLNKEVENNQMQLEKYNKMEIYDIEQDVAIAKKAVIKHEYKIDIGSAIVGLDGSVIFLLNELDDQVVKKHIFRWSPFNEDKKKQSRKREIVDANTYYSIKLYPFERILTFKQSKDTEMYDLFGKASQAKSQVFLFDFNAKKIGDYQISGDIKQIELGPNNQIYALAKDKFSIFQINPNYKNRLEKKHELDVSVSFVYPLGNYIIMKKEASIIIYDKEFDFVMKEEDNEEIESYRVMKIDDKKFILASEQEISLWDLETQSKTPLNIKDYSSTMVELIGNKHLLVADKWIKSFDFYELTK